jgi:hypothetical protein
VSGSEQTVVPDLDEAGCGLCAPPIAGSGFDSYQPIDCSLVQIQTDPFAIASCNYT